MRNPKQILMIQIQMTKTKTLGASNLLLLQLGTNISLHRFLTLGHSDLEFVSYFAFRASNFLTPLSHRIYRTYTVPPPKAEDLCRNQPVKVVKSVG
jgi:hypothetical protein